MDGEYDIYLAGEPVGKASVRRRGLYYLFDCRCRLSGEVVYRLCVKSGEHTESLGIPVPGDGWFRLQTRMPVSRLGEGEFRFSAVPRKEEIHGEFIPVSPEEPFRYLQRLQDAFLEVRDGKPGLRLTAQREISNSSDTGQ